MYSLTRTSSIQPLCETWQSSSPRYAKERWWRRKIDICGSTLPSCTKTATRGLRGEGKTGRFHALPQNRHHHRRRRRHHRHPLFGTPKQMHQQRKALCYYRRLFLRGVMIVVTAKNKNIAVNFIWKGNSRSITEESFRTRPRKRKESSMDRVILNDYLGMYCTSCYPRLGIVLSFSK